MGGVESLGNLGAVVPAVDGAGSADQAADCGDRVREVDEGVDDGRAARATSRTAALW